MFVVASARWSRVRNLQERITVTVRTFAFSFDIETTNFKIRDTRKIIDLFPFMETYTGVCVWMCNFFLLTYNWRSQRTFRGENIEISSYLISAIFQHVSMVTYLFAGDDKLNRSVRYRRYLCKDWGSIRYFDQVDFNANRSGHLLHPYAVVEWISS